MQMIAPSTFGLLSNELLMKKWIFILLFVSPAAIGQVKDSLHFDANPVGYATKLIKVDFLSPLTGNLTLGYETYVKNGMSLEGKVGIIGLGKNIENQKGVFFKFGPKLKLSPDYIAPGMKARHPLQGTYLKPELFFTYYQQNEYLDFSSLSPSAENQQAFALMINIGRQVIFNDKFSVDWFGGVGYGFSRIDNGYQYGIVGGSSSVQIAFSAGFNIGFAL